MARAAGFAGLIAVVLLAGCSGKRPIVVGSKNFTEQVLLGEIIAQHLEKRLQTRVVRRLNLGGTLLAHQALVTGQIDLYPEYSGTALTTVLRLPPAADPASVNETVRREYRKRFGVEWLDPLGFNNSFAMVIRGEDGRTRGISTLSEAERSRPGWRLGVGYEFLKRPDGLPALTRAYKLPLEGAPVTMDLGLLYQALKQKQVDMAAGSATDGLIDALGMMMLKDDRHAFPPYEAAIAVRAESLRRQPELRAALSELAGRFTEKTMRELNHEVDGRHKPVAAVASEWLARRQPNVSEAAQGALSSPPFFHSPPPSGLAFLSALAPPP